MNGKFVGYLHRETPNKTRHLGLFILEIEEMQCM